MSIVYWVLYQHVTWSCVFPIRQYTLQNTPDESRAACSDGEPGGSEAKTRSFKRLVRPTQVESVMLLLCYIYRNTCDSWYVLNSSCVVQRTFCISWTFSNFLCKIVVKNSMKPWVHWIAPRQKSFGLGLELPAHSQRGCLAFSAFPIWIHMMHTYDIHWKQRFLHGKILWKKYCIVDIMYQTTSTRNAILPDWPRDAPSTKSSPRSAAL